MLRYGPEEMRQYTPLETQPDLELKYALPHIHRLSHVSANTLSNDQNFVDFFGCAKDCNEFVRCV
jgi:hypothetical protein